MNFGGGQVDITSGKFVFSASEATSSKTERSLPVRRRDPDRQRPGGPEVRHHGGQRPQLDEGIGTCGKDGQSVPVGVGMPTIKLDRMTVGGTGR